MERTRQIGLCLLEDGGVSIQATVVPDDAGACLRVVEETPVDVFQTLDHWLEAHVGERITITVGGAGSPIATWSTRSTSMALYWVATVLGKSWNPGFKVGPPPEPAVDPASLAPVHPLTRAPAVQSAPADGEETTTKRNEVA